MDGWGSGGGMSWTMCKLVDLAADSNHASILPLNFLLAECCS